MTDKAQIRPLSEDALNRFRITHPDRDLRPLLRRLHRLSHQHQDQEESTDAESSSKAMEERGVELDMVKMELIKWELGVERLMGSVENLKRQKETYLRRAKDTDDRTEQLRLTLEDEKILLARRRRERDWMIKCDEVAKKIDAKGKSRADLDEQITSLRQSLDEHRASHGIYLQTVQSRIDIFAQISTLVEEARNAKLPMEPQVGLPEAVDSPEPEIMDIDESPNRPKDDTAKLNVTALPFQPATTTSGTTSTSLPASRAASPGLVSSPVSSGASRHALPSRPSRPQSTAPAVGGSARLPSRPSTLRSVTTPAGTASLEEGELGGEEEGEVSEQRGVKRSGETRESGRTTRRK